MYNKIINGRVFIIAEVGVNHNSDINMAYEYIQALSKLDIDAIKFQTYNTDLLVSKESIKYKMLKDLEFSQKDFLKIQSYCNEKNILFLSTPFDHESVDFLYQINLPLFKISSGDITNHMLLDYVARKNKPMIVSTGRATTNEIEQALGVIKAANNDEIILLQCTSCYPALPGQLNLRSIPFMHALYKLPVGFSDHSMGLEAAIAAVALGARVVEKHVTLNKKLPGPDHHMSMEMNDFSAMVNSIRNIEIALGDLKKTPCQEELKNSKQARKGIYTNRELKAGDILTKEMFVMKRPVIGFAAQDYKKLIGKQLKKPISIDGAFLKDHVEF